jgi:hypothetical protein
MPITLAGTNQALDASLPTIYREFRLLRDETGVMRSCATSMSLGAHEGNTKYINNYGRLVAYSVTDGADITQSQALADTATGYTPSEVAVQCILGGRTMRRVADPQLHERTARILNNAYDLKEDGDGCTQLASFTGTTGGAAGTVISPGHVAGFGARVMVGNSQANPEPPGGDIYFVTHPLTAHVLAGRLVPWTDVPTGTTVFGTDNGAHAGITASVGGISSEFTADIVRRGYKALGTIGSVIVKTDANLTVSSVNDATGAVFAKEGLIYVSEEQPRIDWDTSDKSMRGAAEGNCWGSYVWGNYRAAAWGNPMTFDASLPTS